MNDMRFNFEGVEPFEASTETLLPAGNYVVKVESADDATTRNGKPMIEVRLAHPSGSIRDWLVITDHEFSLRKVAGLFAAAGVQIKNDMFSSDGHARQDVLDARIRGREVGVIIRDEDDDRPDHMGQKHPKVQGYCTSDRITADAPIDRRGLPPANGDGAPATASREDIPFLRDEVGFEFEPWRGHANR